jgi:hypothetical protein
MKESKAAFYVLKQFLALLYLVGIVQRQMVGSENLA